MGKIISLIEFQNKVGNLVGYKGRDGRNVIRFQPYGVKKSRVKPLQMQRIKFGNLVNMFQAFNGAIAGAFPGKKAGQTDFNAFMQANLPLAIVALTKNEVTLGAAVVQELQISTGELEPIEVSMEVGGKMRTDLSLGELELTAETYVSEFSQAIIENNPDHNFRNGDNIACLIVTQRTSGSDNLPRVHVTKSIVTLDTTDTVNKLYNVVNPAGFGVVDGCLGTKSAVNGGIAWIHKSVRSERPAVSTQRLVVNNDLLANYTSTDAVNRSLASYGGVTEQWLYDNHGLEGDEIAQP